MKVTRRSTLLLALLAPAPSFAAELSEEVLDQLVWDFAGFTYAFEGENWGGVCEYVTDGTKVGFGGEMGCDGVRLVYAEDPQCHSDMVFALKQGCRKIGAGTEVACLSPPQWLQRDVVYLGARASFSYSAEAGRWIADYLICGGD